MDNPIYAEIINLIDSKSMNEHLLANQEELWLGKYVDIIAGAPVSLERKRELLVALQEAAQDALTKGKITQGDWELAEITEHIKFLDDACNKLHSFSPDKSVLIIVKIYYDGESEQHVYTHDEFFPAASYHGAQLAIQRYNDECEIEPGEIPPWYWMLELYQIQEDGTMEPDYTYICSPDGEVQYFHRFGYYKKWKTSKYDSFGGSSVDLNLPVPYQPGDILYIDCRPYTQPAYCLITEVGSDCCGVRCLYWWGHVMSVGALKHGRYSEDVDGEERYISPLYRAELYEGELPQECAFMAQISKRLKQNPECGRILEDMIHDLPTITLKESRP